MPNKQVLEEGMKFAAIKVLLERIVQELHETQHKKSADVLVLKDCYELAEDYFFQLPDSFQDKTHRTNLFGDKDVESAFRDVVAGSYSKQKLDYIVKHFESAQKNAAAHMSSRFYAGTK